MIQITYIRYKIKMLRSGFEIAIKFLFEFNKPENGHFLPKVIGEAKIISRTMLCGINENPCNNFFPEVRPIMRNWVE